jgi:Phosphotransferase enzyme family
MTSGPVTELLARASSREEIRPGDARSTSTFERLTIDGEAYFLKRLSPATDWIMRVTGDHVHRPYLVWRAGVMDMVPACIDHAVVAMEIAGDGDDAMLSMLMRDIGDYLVPEGDDKVTPAQHASFIEHLAAMSAAFWGWEDDVGGLTTMAQRIRFFDLPNVARELACADPPGAIVAADAGWKALPGLAPRLANLAFAVQRRPEIVTEPLSETPSTFLHGDWKMGNLGSHPNGRTILIDWAYPGSGPACWDLCWYLALNRARLPESKETSVERFRAALEASGVSTSGWFETQLDLCMVGIMAAFGWEKAIGDRQELEWWDQRVAEAARRQAVQVPETPG